MPAAEMAKGKSIASQELCSVCELVAFAQHQPDLQETHQKDCYKCFRARSPILPKRVHEFLELRTVENRCTFF